MNFLGDENVPRDSVRALRAAGHDVVSISERHPGLPDRQVLEMAHVERRVLLTFDRDFGELIFQQQLPPPPAVVYLRFTPARPDEPGQIVLTLLESMPTIENSFIVLEHDTFRIRPLQEMGS